MTDAATGRLGRETKSRSCENPFSHALFAGIETSAIHERRGSAPPFLSRKMHFPKSMR